jgi:hypothetical protein
MSRAIVFARSVFQRDPKSGKGFAARNGGADMLTTILAYIIGFLGLVMIAVGIWGAFR